MDRKVSADDIKEALSDNAIDDFDRSILCAAYSLLNNEEIDTTILGAYAIYLNNLKFRDIQKSRRTKDIDVSFKTTSENLKEAFSTWASKANYQIKKLRVTDNGNLIVFVLIPIINKNLEIIPDKEPLVLRIDCMADETLEKGVSSINDIIEMKLNLKLAVRNRRLKDLVDVMNCLELYYPHGIEKQQLLGMIQDTEQLKTISVEDMDNCFSQATSFSNVYMTQEQVHRYISNFFSMTSGLREDSIPDTHLFYDGYWNPRK